MNTERLAGLLFTPDPNDRRSPEVEEMAGRLAWERGGQTDPLSGYDLDRAEKLVSGEANVRAENARLLSRLAVLEATGQFLLDRLVDHEVSMTSDDDAREWMGHVTPAMARFRATLAQAVAGEGL